MCLHACARAWLACVTDKRYTWTREVGRVERQAPDTVTQFLARGRDVRLPHHAVTRRILAPSVIYTKRFGPRERKRIIRKSVAVSRYRHVDRISRNALRALLQKRSKKNTPRVPQDVRRESTPRGIPNTPRALHKRRLT